MVFIGEINIFIIRSDDRESQTACRYSLDLQVFIIIVIYFKFIPKGKILHLCKLPIFRRVRLPETRRH